MPYALQGFYRPEWDRQFPEAWERRLREFSPVSERVAYLWPRWFEAHESWFVHDRGGLWTIYSATPAKFVSPDRAEQFRQHWSELPDTQRVGRQAVVSNYQHYMWHTRGVEVRIFWILQGENGGTPAVYSYREERILAAEELPAEPIPLGAMPSCPFDERAVAAIVSRDALIQAGGNLDAMLKQTRPDVLKAQDDETEREFRRIFLDKWNATMVPQADYMRFWLSRSENREQLPPAPDGLADAVAGHRENWIQNGSVIGAKVARSRRLQVAVK